MFKVCKNTLKQLTKFDSKKLVNNEGFKFLKNYNVLFVPFNNQIRNYSKDFNVINEFGDTLYSSVDKGKGRIIDVEFVERPVQKFTCLSENKQPIASHRQAFLNILLEGWREFVSFRENFGESLKNDKANYIQQVEFAVENEKGLLEEDKKLACEIFDRGCRNAYFSKKEDIGQETANMLRELLSSQEKSSHYLTVKVEFLMNNQIIVEREVSRSHCDEQVYSKAIYRINTNEKGEPVSITRESKIIESSSEHIPFTEETKSSEDYYLIENK